MADDIKEIAEALGAKIVGKVPKVGGSAFDMMRLKEIMRARLEPSHGKRPGRPTNITWVTRPKVPISAETERKLALLAEKLSTPQRKVTPMQVAAQLLEDAV